VSEFAFGTVAPPLAACRLTVAIPARNEASLLRGTLDAFAAQTSLHGAPLDPSVFDIIVFANNCDDATADVARSFAAAHPELPTFVVSANLLRSVANVGTARKLVMDMAARRFRSCGRPHGIVATTDADTLVAPDWVATILSECAPVDAVAGHVTIAESELATLLAPARFLYSRELAYRRAFAEISHALDPLAHDPAPRHASFVGASFAVKTRAYFDAGGVPPLAVLEDRTFFEGLHRIDARVRHSLRVRAFTSARRVARVNGGFGSFVDALHRHGSSGETFKVEHPQATLDQAELRGALRRIWRGDNDPADVTRVEQIVSAPASVWRPCLDRTLPFGTAYETVGLVAQPQRYEPVPVTCAIAGLRFAAARLNAPSATRMAAASGAG
jgi:glycosyltransferase involved in cell wall biosynthesis